MSEPGDDHLSRAADELGEPEALFQISRARFYTKLWIGLGLIGGSVLVTAALIAFLPGFDVVCARCTLKQASCQSRQEDWSVEFHNRSSDEAERF